MVMASSTHKCAFCKTSSSFVTPIKHKRLRFSSTTRDPQRSSRSALMEARRDDFEFILVGPDTAFEASSSGCRMKIRRQLQPRPSTDLKEALRPSTAYFVPRRSRKFSSFTEDMMHHHHYYENTPLPHHHHRLHTKASQVVPATHPSASSFNPTVVDGEAPTTHFNFCSRRCMEKQVLGLQNKRKHHDELETLQLCERAPFLPDWNWVIHSTTLSHNLSWDNDQLYLISIMRP